MELRQLRIEHRRRDWRSGDVDGTHSNLTVLPGYGVINLGAGYEEQKFDIAITLY